LIAAPQVVGGRARLDHSSGGDGRLSRRDPDDSDNTCDRHATGTTRHLASRLGLAVNLPLI
jgi:hypothetical protein